MHTQSEKLDKPEGDGQHTVTVDDEKMNRNAQRIKEYNLRKQWQMDAEIAEFSVPAEPYLIAP
jgi:hypothetical protein